MEFRPVFRTLAATRAVRVPLGRSMPSRFLSTTRALRDAEEPQPKSQPPWSIPRYNSSGSAADKLRQSLKGNNVRAWDSLLVPRPPTGGNTFQDPAPPRSPLLAGRRQQLLDSPEPSSVYGLMGHDMGLEDSAHGLFSEGDFLARHVKAAQTPEMRLKPNTGRMVKVHNKIDFARGLKMLDIQMKHNRVKMDSIKQKRHQRPGLKRKELKSQRWVRKFKVAFKHTVSRVRDLQRQGW
ncbi:hypothetical protein GQ53DRAFT_750813 [Thozetella sp. PMI_491]|nr:hypothetical protein GQ53DRAFT_750813 [Thozetella sp. PMI_491]